MHRSFILGVVFVGLFTFGAFALMASGVSNIAPLETIAPVFSDLKVVAERTVTGATLTISFKASEPLDADPVVTVNGVGAMFADTSKSAVGYVYTCAIEESALSDIVAVQIFGSDVVGNPGEYAEDVSIDLEEPTQVPLRVWPLVVMILLSTGFLMLRRGRSSEKARGASLSNGILVLFIVCCQGAYADSPSVTGVHFSQGPSETGGTQVDIYYDLTAPNGPCTITVALSMDGGLDGYSHAVTAVSGDLVNVEEGPDKHIIWRIASDYMGVDIQRAQLRVTADDGRVQYPVTFDANGGAVPIPESKEVLVGSPYGALATTTRAGYLFSGWWTEASGGVEITSSTIVAISAAQTLHAHWTPVPIPAMVSFSINDDAPSTTTAAVTLNNTATNGPTDYMASEAADFSGASWQPYASDPAFSLSTVLGGTKTVYFKVRNANGESPAVSDTISLTEDTVLLPGGVPLTVIWCPSGSFMMGRASSSELGSDASEDPQHLVTFAVGFWMGKYEVTQGQWMAITGNNPAQFQGDLQRPVEQVSWTNINSMFLTSLNSYTGKSFRLPSEAEWEYACRAGTTERFFWGDDPTYTQIDNYAWYMNNSYPSHRVGTTAGPNAWGLYDMSGNVWEWCRDWYNTSYLGAPTDGSAWLSPPTFDRVIRGGAWSHPGNTCRSASRSAILPSYSNETIGFRIAR